MGSVALDGFVDVAVGEEEEEEEDHSQLMFESSTMCVQ